MKTREREREREQFRRKPVRKIQYKPCKPSTFISSPESKEVGHKDSSRLAPLPCLTGHIHRNIVNNSQGTFCGYFLITWQAIHLDTVSHLIMALINYINPKKLLRLNAHL